MVPGIGGCEHAIERAFHGGERARRTTAAGTACRQPVQSLLHDVHATQRVAATC
jgi:hypothetical protein